MRYQLSSLFERYPELSPQRENILQAYSIFKDVFDNDNTLFVCGNGGSAADAEHIVGELMKGFLLKRPVEGEIRSRLIDKYNNEGECIVDNLQEGLKVISLTSHLSLSTAFSNDVAPSLVFAQQLYVLGREKDALLAISTSGNSKNIIQSIQLAKVKNIQTVVLTGASGGQCAELADCVIKAPADETYLIQEYHQPIYHALCALLEENYYGEAHKKE